MSAPKRGLGRGLDALLPSRPPAPKAPAQPAGALTPATTGDDQVFRCPIDKLTPMKGQPRQHIRPEALAELAQSIREHGLIEPLVARRIPGEKLELIAGERRWRASQLAGLREVLVVVREVSPEEAFELALIENVQRADLDPIEFAEALDRLLKEHSYTQESLALRVGKDRSTIANALRLLKLPAAVRQLIIAGTLSEGHGRALLGAPSEATMLALAEKVQRGRLSVRQTEQLVRAARAKAEKKPPPAAKTPSVRDLELRLSRHLGTPCHVADRGGKGEVKIQYASLDELDRLLEILL